MSSSKDSKVQNGEALRILNLMVLHGDNRFCFECHQRGPLYVNMTIGSFVCTTCGGALRNYNHRIKAIHMTNFSEDEIKFLHKRGNKACQKMYLSGVGETAKKFDIGMNLDEYLRMKYEFNQWYRKPTNEIEKEAIADNKEIMDKAERQEIQKNHSVPGINASKGLIITPPFQQPSKVNYSTLPNARLNKDINSDGSAVNKPQHSLATPLSKPIIFLSQNQPTAYKPASEVFNGFEDDTFPAPAPATMSKPTTAPVDPFDLFNQTAPLQNTREHDFFPSMDSVTRPGQQSLFLEPQHVKNNPTPKDFLLTSEPRATVQSHASRDKYAPLAELDTILKMNATVKASPPVFPSTATAKPPPSEWSALTGAAPIWPAVVFSQPAPIPPTGAPKLSNPFTGTAAAVGVDRPGGTLNPFMQNFTSTATTAPRSSSAAIPFMPPSGINGLPTGGGGGCVVPVNPLNPFLSASPGAVSASNPFIQPFSGADTSLGKAGPVPPDAFLASHPTSTANQYCWGPVSGTGTSPFPSWSSSSLSNTNNAAADNPWTNGTSSAGDKNKF